MEKTISIALLWYLFICSFMRIERDMSTIAVFLDICDYSSISKLLRNIRFCLTPRQPIELDNERKCCTRLGRTVAYHKWKNETDRLINCNNKTPFDGSLLFLFYFIYFVTPPPIGTKKLNYTYFVLSESFFLSLKIDLGLVLR